MRYDFLALVLLAVLSLAGCNLGRDDNGNIPPTQQLLAPVDPGGRPTVTINSPADGDEFVVNEPILISVNATDNVGVTSVQLRVNNQIVRTVASESSTGDPQISVLLDYTSRRSGNLVMEVVAFREGTQSDPAKLNLTVRNSTFQITATVQQDNNIPAIDPNDPTCRALVNTGLNFRRGPSTDFDIIRVLGVGEVLPIIGRLADNSWWQLSSNTSIGWVDARFVTTYGICNGIVAIDPPTTPTATIQVTATSTPTDSPTATLVTPNLWVSNITGSDTVIIPSGSNLVVEPYNVNVTNLGGIITDQFAVVARILPSGDEFDAGVVSNLDTGQSISLSVDIAFDQTGTFALEFIADAEDDIEESDEGDNSRLYNVRVQSE